MQLETTVPYFIFIPFSVSLITTCSIQPNAVSCCFLLVLSYSPSGDFPSYKMCGHAARQVRAAPTSQRYQCSNKGPLVRSWGDTRCLLLSQPGSGGVANWATASQRTWWGRWDGVVWFCRVFLGLLRDPQRRCVESRALACKHSWVLRVFPPLHNGPFSLYCQVANHLLGQKTPYL